MREEEEEEEDEEGGGGERMAEAGRESKMPCCRLRRWKGHKLEKLEKAKRYIIAPELPEGVLACKGADGDL